MTGSGHWLTNKKWNAPFGSYFCISQTVTRPARLAGHPYPFTTYYPTFAHQKSYFMNLIQELRWRGLIHDIMPAQKNS
jgi:hypothetical protein